MPECLRTHSPQLFYPLFQKSSWSPVALNTVYMMWTFTFASPANVSLKRTPLANLFLETPPTWLRGSSYQHSTLFFAHVLKAMITHSHPDVSAANPHSVSGPPQGCTVIIWGFFKGFSAKTFWFNWWPGVSQVELVVKNPSPSAGDKGCRFDPWAGNIPWRRVWQLTPVFLPGESHPQRSLAGYSP